MNQPSHALHHVIGGVRSNVAITVVHKAGYPQPFILGGSAERIERNPGHSRFGFRLVELVEVGIVEDANLVINVLFAVKLNRTVEGSAGVSRTQTEIVPGNQVDVTEAVQAFFPVHQRIHLLSEADVVLFESFAIAEGVQFSVAILEPERQVAIRRRGDRAHLAHFVIAGGRKLAIDVGSYAEADEVIRAINKVEIGAVDFEGAVAVIARTREVSLGEKLRSEAGVVVIRIIRVSEGADLYFAAGQHQGIAGLLLLAIPCRLAL